MRCATWLSCVVFSLVLAQPATAQGSAADAVRQADLDFCQATREKGLEGWVSFFAENAVLGQFTPPAQGKDGVRKAYKEFFELPGLDFQWAPQRAEVFPAGTLGYSTGRYTLSFAGKDGKRVKRTGNYLTVWEQQKDGSWKAIADFGTREEDKPAAKP